MHRLNDNGNDQLRSSWQTNRIVQYDFDRTDDDDDDDDYDGDTIAGEDGEE